MTGSHAAGSDVVPGPTPLDMLRNARGMRHDPLPFLQWCAGEFGPLTEFPMPKQRVFFGNSPEVVRQLLQTQHRDTDRATVQYRTLSLVTGNGLLTSDGELWMRQRRLMQPAFHRAVLDRLVSHIDVAVSRLLATWDEQRDGDVVDVDAAMMHTALEVVGRALFDHDLSGDAERLVNAVLEALDVVVARARSPLPLPLDWPTPSNRSLRRSLKVLDDAVAAMLRERRSRGPHDAQDGPADLLGMLLAAGEEGERGFDDRQLRDEIVTLIVAGHETVASSLTWTWHLLAQNPDAEKVLHAELDEVLGDRPPTFGDLPRLVETKRVVDEALRLYPPAWVISRRAVVDNELAGHVIPAGSFVFVSPYVLQRTPQWWPDAERFDPGRFAAGEAAGSLDRFSYIPFGAGPNLCIGRDLALMEATLLVAAVASRYRLTPAPGVEVKAEPLVTIRPKGGLPMVLRRR